VAPARVSVPRRVFRQLVLQPVTLVAGCFLLLLVGLAVVVALADPLNPTAQDLLNRLSRPSGEHWLGTDNLGRDTLARMVHATQVAVLALLQGVSIAALLGIAPGLLAGFRGGRLDAVLARIADILVVFPGLVLALAIVGVLGPSLTNAMIAIGIINAPRIFRVVRSAALGLRDVAFVDAARTMGARSSTIIRWHILANTTGVLVVQLALVAAQVLLAESSLSYLGLGVQAPEATWGSMIRDAEPHIAAAPWGIVFPGLAITMTALALNFTADGIARALRTSVGTEVEGER
jgi:ABC-type dipeptide/oligopeptide/nickel transport system permease subunit